jgi:hypothetical protein
MSMQRERPSPDEEPLAEFSIIADGLLLEGSQRRRATRRLRTIRFLFLRRRILGLVDRSVGSRGLFDRRIAVLDAELRIKAKEAGDEIWSLNRTTPRPRKPRT